MSRGQRRRQRRCRRLCRLPSAALVSKKWKKESGVDRPKKKLLQETKNKVIDTEAKKDKKTFQTNAN